VSEFDPSDMLDSSSTPLSRDFIGLCIGILSVVIVILTVTVCKWSRCLCLKHNHNNFNPTEGVTLVIQPNTSTLHPHQQRRRSPNQWLSPCDHHGNVQPPIRTTRDGVLSSPEPPYNGSRPRDVKASRVTFATLPGQSSQQLVPRLSLSPQVSGSSITRIT